MANVEPQCPGKTLWILEDDSGARFVFQEILGEKHPLRFFHSLTELRTALTSEPGPLPELLIADLILGDGNFLEYLEKNTETFPKELRFIAVSAVDEYSSLDASYRLNAIDYLIKPFRASELRAKVEHALSIAKEDSIRIKEENAATYRLMSTLTPTERKVFTLLISKIGQTLDRALITAEIWPQQENCPKNLDMQLSNLRKKLSDSRYRLQSDGAGLWTLVRTELKS